MAKFVSYGERSTETIVFYDGTGPLRITHCPQLSQPWKL